MEIFQRFKDKILSLENPTIVHHYDTDGIASAAIIYRFLLEHGKQPSIITVKGINRFRAEELKDIPEKIVLDVGTNHIDSLGDVVVIDHHYPIIPTTNPNLINAHLIGIDGSKSISSAGMASLIVKQGASTAILGAIGDRQYPFIGENAQLLEQAIKHREIIMTRDLKAYGKYRRPLFVMLSYMFKDFALDKKQAIKYIHTMNIKQKVNGLWRDYNSLNSDEKTIFLKHVLEKAYRLGILDDVYGEVFMIKPFYSIDMNELSSIINATGRKSKAEVGIKLAMGDKDALDKGIEIWKSYQRDLSSALEYAYDNLEYRKDYIWLDGRERIDSSIIGVVVSIITGQSSNKDTVIGISKDDDIIKVSIRSNTIDVGKLIDSIYSENKTWEGGGHIGAGGFTIPEDDLEKFVQVLEIKLRQNNFKSYL